MFANLKNKLIEEVKASPSKFQQFANAAQAAVTSSTNTPSGSESVSGNENFFSITEEDTPQNSPHKPIKLPAGGVRAKGPLISPQSNNGAIPRTRKLSNSSVASDVSFRLPTYEHPAVYHLQSDLDVSASEVEDSTSTSRLDLINKEQLYDAYKKALESYQKYRARYADLAKKYKDLERDSTKARSVLVETQEKAIRRISELREQCSLEQQAKAHLEEALRMEMDDMQCKMQAYQTKLTLLGENPDNIIALTKSEPLLQLNNGTNASDPGNLINLDVENNRLPNDGKISNLEKTLAEKQNQIEELTQKLQEAIKAIDVLKKQEEENAISLAQTKQAIYSELENKETQVKRLETNLTEVEEKFEQTLKEKNQLSSQVVELDNVKEKLKTLTLAKQEAEAKVISLNHMHGEVKQQLTAKEKIITGLDERLQNLTKEHEQTAKNQEDLSKALEQRMCELEGLQKERDNLKELHEQMTKNQENISKELEQRMCELEGLQKDRDNSKELHEQMTKNQENNSKELEQRMCELEGLQKERDNLKELHEQSTRNLEDLSKELEAIRTEKLENEIRVKQLESEIKILNEQNENTKSDMIGTLKEALEEAALEGSDQLKSAKESLAAKEKELKSTNNKLGKLRKQLEAQEANSKEIERLRQCITEYEKNLSEMQEEHKLQEENAEREKGELKAQVTSILKEIGTMEEEMRAVRALHSDLEAEKRSLEQKIENMTKQSQDASEGTQRWKDELSETVEKLKTLEQKLQQVESENSQLAEKNCLLEENSNRLEKLIAEHERQRSEVETEFNRLKQQLETAESTIQKLNEKMSQVLDENSRLHNSDELMEHEYRSLQDKCEATEKEKLCLLDSNKCLDNELKTLKDEIESLTRENNNLSEISNNLRGDLSETLEKLQVEESKFNKLSSDLENAVKAKEGLEVALKAVRQEMIGLKNDTTASEAMEQNMQLIDDLRRQLSESEEKMEISQKEISELNSKLTASDAEIKELQKSNEELLSLRERVYELQQQLQEAKNEIQQIEENHKISQSEKQTASEAQTSNLEAELKVKQEELLSLTELNQSLQSRINDLDSSNNLRIEELESRLKEADAEIQNLKQSTELSAESKKKLENYEQLELGNEYLNTLVDQLQADIRQQSEDRANVAQEIALLKTKIQSQQCELYVLNENQEKHSAELDEKSKEVLKTQEEVRELNETLEKERSELTRQSEHAKFITEQNDNVQKELLSCQQQLSEIEKDLLEEKISCDEMNRENLKLIDQLASAEAQSKQHIENLRDELERSASTIETLSKEVDDLNKEIAKVDILKDEKNELLKQVEGLKVELSEKVIPVKVESATESAKATQFESENLRKINEQLQRELEDLQYKSRAKIDNLTQEIEDLLANSKHITERLALFERQPDTPPAPPADADRIQQEKDELESKLKTIMHDVQDVSNRNLFLEQKCENYLILEQSNERLKSQNEKLSRQLDETLVSMHHHEGITANTEFEYLKNIMFQYLTGTVNGNNETLVKVISAVLKFTPQQTQVALEKEHQRRSLLGQLNKLL